MSIVFSAIALDSELSRLFYKWTNISALQAGHEFDEEACEKLLLKFHNFKAKMAGVSELLCSGGIERFVGSSPEFSKELTAFPSLTPGSLAADFHKTVFKPRNKILHQGLATFKEEDANRAWSIANLGLRILLAMDHKKRAVLK